MGSSSIRLWPTRECFKELPVINRGFSGSQISEVNYYAKRYEVWTQLLRLIIEEALKPDGK